MRKVTQFPSRPRRPSSGVNFVVFSLVGGRRKAARQTREGIALSVISYSVWDGVPRAIG